MALSTKATVGTVAFHGWSGWLPAMLPQLDVYQRTGQTGSGAQTTATRSEPTTVSAWIGCTSSGEMQAKAAAVQALCGTVVAVTDPYGRAFARVRVYPVAVSPSIGRGSAVSGAVGMTYLLRCTLGLEVLP
jgi:hypothetical protein